MTREDQVEIRKSVWRAAKSHFGFYKQALNLTPMPLVCREKGLIVYADLRRHYCDGRVDASCICMELETKRAIVFLPFPDESQEVEPPPVNTRIYAHV